MVGTSGSAPRVFISYSHQDESWKQRLETQLNVLDMEGILDVWHDRRIAAGDDWHGEIKQAIRKADVAVLLISADFLTSRFIRDEEVGPFLERRHRDGMRVIPILIRPCPWRKVAWLARIQMRPADGREVSAGNDHQIDKDFSSIAEEISDLLTVRKKRPHQPDGPRIDLTRLPAVGEHLLGREAELAQLDDAWAESSKRIISLVAWGGVGKSALTKHWLDRLAADGFRGVEAVYAWSFYSQGTNDSEGSADEFFDSALRWFGEEEPESLRLDQRAERLAELVQAQKTLLVLDGLEPLQHGAEAVQAGELKDRALADLLRSLSWQNPGLCLITTRVLVEDIRDRRQSAAPVIALDHLSDEAGAALLKEMGIEGDRSELEAASRKVQGHGLALNLLATYLRDFCGRDARRIDEVDLFHTGLRRGEHAKRIMAAYERAFADGPERAALHLLGFFDRPVQRSLIDVLRQAPVIEGLNEPLVGQTNKDWQGILTRLEKAGLMSDEHKDELDAHPLVREHFGVQLREKNEEAWKAGHLRLYEHLKKQAEHRPDTLAEMAPLFQAVHHGCQAGRRQEALDEVYEERINRGQEFYSTNKLGAFGADLGLVASFFDTPFEHPATNLTETSRAWLLGHAAFRLRALGRLNEAVAPMRTGLVMAVEQGGWDEAARRARNLSELQLTMGDVAAALTSGEAAVEYADRGGDAFDRISTHEMLAEAKHQAYEVTAAQTLFDKAEAIQAEHQPGYPLLYSTGGYGYCDLLLTLDQAEAVRERATEALKIAVRNSWLLDIALDHLSLGRAALALGNLDEARRRLDRAVDGLREAGDITRLPRGLLARAALSRDVEKFPSSRRDLDEAMRIAGGGGMRLFQCDAHLGYARLALAEGKPDDAREHLKSAKALVAACGYHRRDGELSELEKALAQS